MSSLNEVQRELESLKGVTDDLVMSQQVFRLDPQAVMVCRWLAEITAEMKIENALHARMIRLVEAKYYGTDQTPLASS